MSEFVSVDQQQYSCKPFKEIGSEWMAITTESDGKVNTMTASWGGFGVMWGKNVAFIVLRPQRYTKELLDQSDMYSLSFLDHQKYAKIFGYIGSVSGRNEDKMAKSELTVLHEKDTPFIGEAHTVFLCKKLSLHALPPEGLVDSSIDTKWYPNNDYHTLYIGEVVEILQKNS